jgi:hypothetical protein
MGVTERSFRADQSLRDGWFGNQVRTGNLAGGQAAK